LDGSYVQEVGKNMGKRRIRICCEIMEKRLEEGGVELDKAGNLIFSFGCWLDNIPLQRCPYCGSEIEVMLEEIDTVRIIR